MIELKKTTLLPNSKIGESETSSCLPESFQNLPTSHVLSPQLYTSILHLVSHIIPSTPYHILLSHSSLLLLSHELIRFPSCSLFSALLAQTCILNGRPIKVLDKKHAGEKNMFKDKLVKDVLLYRRECYAKSFLVI